MTGLDGSEKAAKGSGRGYPDVGWRALGDGFLSGPTSPKGLDGVEDPKGEGRPWVGAIWFGVGGAKDDCFAPENTSEMEGKDWR